MCIFHKWTKWKQYNVNTYRVDNGIKHTVEIERRQHRYCTKCNKEQDATISVSN